MSRWVVISLFLMAALLPQSVHARLAWPAVPVPADATGERVSDHMTYNGLDMRASRFTVSQSVNEVIAFYRRKWGTQMVVTPFRGKQIIGHLEDDYYVTVEVVGAGGGTRGQIGIMKIPSEPPPAGGLARDMLLPSGTQVMEEIVYMDDPARTRTLNMSNKLTPAQNQSYFRRAYAGRGYSLAQGSTSCIRSSPSCVSYLEKSDTRMIVATNSTPSDTSVVVVMTRK